MTGGHGIKPGGGVELDGHLPLFAQFEDGGLIGFHVARGDGGDVFRPQTEIGEMAFRDEPQFQGFDPTTATHAENKGFARDVKVPYLFGHRAFGIPEYGMASGNRFRAVCVDNGASQQNGGRTPCRGAEIGFSGGRAALRLRMASVLRMRACSWAAASSKAGRPFTSVAVLITACPPVTRATRRARRFAPPRCPDVRPTTWLPLSEHDNTAGSLVLSLSSGAILRTAMPVALMKICASNCLQLADRVASKVSPGVWTTSGAPVGRVEWITAGSPSPAAFRQRDPLVGKGIQGTAPVKGFVGKVVSVTM